MRCLGATQAQLFAFTRSNSLARPWRVRAGCVLGFVAQEAIGAAVAEVVRSELPPPRLAPAVQGFLVGLVLLLGFALPPLVQLKNVPAVRVIRRESGAPKGGTLAAYAAGWLAWRAPRVAGGRPEARPYRGGRLRRRGGGVLPGCVGGRSIPDAPEGHLRVRTQRCATASRTSAPRARQRGADREPSRLA